MVRMFVAGLVLLCASPVGAQLFVADVPGESSVVAVADDALCLPLEPLFSPWVERMRLVDWELSYRCDLAATMARDADAFSEIEWTVKRSNVVVNPINEGYDLVAIHELLHLWAGEIRLADSDLIEEQAVEVLSRLIHSLYIAQECSP